MTKILVADDERDIRELIGFTLRFAGFEVVLTADGIEAIEKASVEKPDLILLDVRMPKMTGYEVCRQLKENPDTGTIPIVFLSAKGQEGEIKQGLTEIDKLKLPKVEEAYRDLDIQVKKLLKEKEFTKK